MDWASEFIYTNKINRGKWFLDIANIRESENLFYQARTCYREAIQNFDHAYQLAKNNDQPKQHEALALLTKAQNLLATNPEREEEFYQNQMQ